MPTEQLTTQELLDRGRRYIDGDDPAEHVEGARIMEFLLSQNPTNYAVLFFLASGFMRLGRYVLSEMLFRQAISMGLADGKEMPEAWNNLGYVLQHQGRLQETRDCFFKALEHRKDDAGYYNNIATLYVNEGEPEKCIEWCNKSLAVNPNANDAVWNRALAYLELGDWPNGWKGYREGAQMKARVRNFHADRETPYWDGTPGQSVVVYGEQGVGDELLGLSMLAEAAERANIIYEAHPRLVNIVRANFGDRFPIYGTRKQTEVPWTGWHDIDAKIPIMGLGELFRQRDEDFPRQPYLQPYPEAVEYFRQRLAEMGPRPKIGISWKGGTGWTRFDLRSIPLPFWQPVFEAIDADWISLQYDPAKEPGQNTGVVRRFNESGVGYLHHWPEDINDLDMGYAGMLPALDLVITVNTSVVHACGAFGVPCWTLTPRGCAWRYNVPGAVSCGDDRMIWYGDHMQQFRQTTAGDWGDVLRRVVLSLQRWNAEREAA